MNRRLRIVSRVLAKTKPVIHSAAGQIVVAGASLVGIRVYTELLTREEFGFAMMAMGVAAFLDGAVVMALNQTLLSICAGMKDEDRQRQVAIGLAFRLFRPLAFALAPLAALGLTLAAAFPADRLFALAPALALVYLAEEIAKTSMLTPLAARRDYLRFSLWSATEAAATVAVTGLSLAYIRADAIGFLLGLVVARGVTTGGFLFVYFGGRYFRSADVAAAAPYWATAIRYGAPVSAMAPIGWVGAYLDRYVVSAAGGLASAGVYAAVAGLVGRPYAVTTAILTNYFRPLLFQGRGSRAETIERARIQWRWIVAAGAVGLLGAAAIALFSGLATSLALAPEYRAGAPAIMLVLAFAQTFAIMTHAVDNAILSSGASARLLRIQAWLVVVALILVPVWTLRFGAVGAAIGRLLSEAVKFGVTLLLSRRLFGAPEPVAPEIVTP